MSGGKWRHSARGFSGCLHWGQNGWGHSHPVNAMSLHASVSLSVKVEIRLMHARPWGLLGRGSELTWIRHLSSRRV